MILSDNTVIPSYLDVRGRGVPMDDGSLTNLGLRLGEVKEIVYPDDPRSISKRLLEYRVEVQHRDGYGPGTTLIYDTCMVANLFGGMADVFRYTLRQDDQSKTAESGLGVGSKVLILCVNGQTTRAIILGGVRDTHLDQSTVETKDDGHNLYFEFNGLSFRINKDGEARIQFKGATKVDGSLAGDNNGPTTVEFRKDGSLAISTKDENQSILIDNASKKVDFSFDSSWSVNVNGNVAEKYGRDWQVTAGTTITLGATGAIALASSTGTMAMSCAGGASITSAGLSIGKATDAMLLGETYRKHQSALHQQTIAGLQDLGRQLGVAGSALTTVAALHKIPVSGPVTASGMVQIAAQALLQAVQSVQNLIGSIANFEGQAVKYLSLVNKHD